MPALRTHNHVQLLELDADKPSLPTLAVIAPTPRTSSFTFPISHNLDISPYSTPSNSPFEPDLNSMDLTSPASSYLPTPPSTRPLSRESSVSVSSPSSNAGADAERRPKKGDGDYVKRPENAFILFRRKCCEDRQQAEEGGRTKKQRQADLSKTISQKWKNLPLKDREYWEDLAKEKKRKHQEMYPDYVYRPQRVRDKDGRVRNKTYTKRNRGKRSEQREVDTEGETAFVVRSTSRSTSASTTPLSYHTVHIPIVLPRSSCSSSPPSLPISVQPNSYAEIPDFDYVPNSRSSNSDSLFQLQARGLQSSDLVRDLFDLQDQTTKLTDGVCTQLQSLSPLSSIASSPVSGPFTPTSTLDQHHFGQFPFDHPNHQIPSDLDVQIATPSDMEPNFSSYTWDPSTIWEREPSMLMCDDFDLHVIPPIELGQTYGEDDVFGIAPAAITFDGFSMQDFSQYSQNFLSMDCSAS